ncbi:MAG: HlyD family secretion protein [Alphaproteobacteria bacterium]|nr:MAG: HlyD family secretion protein [Alphaproteobacteria bacterium]
MSTPDQDQQPTEPPAGQPAEGADASKSVKRGGQIIGLVIVLSLAWYLTADRFTPYTSQARVEGYVVGVAPKVAGLVTQVWVKNNQEVKQGQRLFQIDPLPYEIAQDKARSDLESARRQVKAGDAAVIAAKANLRAAEANRLSAAQNASRLGRLHTADPGTISVRQLEMAQAGLDKAEAQVVAAEASIQQAIEQKGGEDDENNSIINSALSAVAKADLNLKDSVVTASARGVVTDLRADVGLYAGAGSPVMTIVAIHDVWINAEFTENNLGHIEVGSPVEIVFDVLPGRVFDGRIRSIGLGVSAGKTTAPGTLPTIDNNRDWLRQSQRYPVIIEFQTDQKGLRNNLRMGGQASVMVYTKGTTVLAVLGKAYIRLMSWLSYAY